MHLGVTDASLIADFQSHYNNLSTLISNVRTIFDCENLPFIAGDFVQHWKTENMEICTPVINAIKEVCLTIGNSAFIETTGLQSNDQKIGNQDTIHFCREALYQLGMKYFSAFENLTSVN